jgi:hypothetical protein
MELNNAEIAMLSLLVLALLVVYFGVVRPGLDDDDVK